MPKSAGHPSSPLRSRYRLLALIGSGQFGQVYCAVNRATGELVAMKNLHPRGFPTHLFIRELRLLVELQHPHIVAFHALDYTHSGRYLVMEYCEGGTLRDLIEADVQFSLLQRLTLIADVLRGLDYAHQANVIHCDLKPENILLTLTPQGWFAKISDFGIARLIQETQGSVMGMGATGSPAYMAPERFYGKFSVASDLYAVGVMLYELLTGDRPFSGKPGELMSAHLNKSVTFADDTVPFVLRSLISKSLQKLPVHRFASAKDMLQSLELAMDVLAHEQQGTPTLAWRKTPESDNPIILNPAAANASQPLSQSDLNVTSASHFGWSVSLVTADMPDEQSDPIPSGSQLLIRSHESLLPLRALHVARAVSQVVILSRRHAIALSPSPKTHTTQLLAFNRRGKWMGQLQISAVFSSVTASLANPCQHFWAVIHDPEPMGLLIQLRPYQLRQCPLPFVPRWQVATDGGVLLAEPFGKIIGLDWQGHCLGSLQIPLTVHQTITAFSARRPWQIAIAISEGREIVHAALDLQKRFELRLQELQA